MNTNTTVSQRAWERAILEMPELRLLDWDSLYPERAKFHTLFGQFFMEEMQKEAAPANAPTPEPAQNGQWRLLERGETFQSGDSYDDSRLPIPNPWIGTPVDRLAHRRISIPSAPPTDGKSKEQIMEFIYRVERMDFRTEHDSGANPMAMMMWNHVRVFAGLEKITPEDLPTYQKDVDRYVMPPNSKLLTSAQPATSEPPPMPLPYEPSQHFSQPPTTPLETGISIRLQVAAMCFSGIYTKHHSKEEVLRRDQYGYPSKSVEQQCLIQADRLISAERGPRS